MTRPKIEELFEPFARNVGGLAKNLLTSALEGAVTSGLEEAQRVVQRGALEVDQRIERAKSGVRKRRRARTAADDVIDVEGTPERK